MSLFDRLPHRVDLYPPTVARDSGGGTSLTYPAARSTDVPCLICSPTDTTQDRFSQDNLVGQYTLAFRGTVTVLRGDKVVVTDSGGLFDGVSMHVTGIKYQPAVGGIAAHLHVAAERVV